jgi:hypothetical protein
MSISAKVRAAASAAGLSPHTVAARIRYGWPEDKLYIPVWSKTTIAAAARAAGLDPKLVYGRIYEGCTLEQACSYPRSTSWSQQKEPSVRARALANGINPGTAYGRIHAHGWSIDKAVNEPVPAPLLTKREAEAHGLTPGFVRHRLKLGYSKEEALAMDRLSICEIDLCKKYGIGYGVFRHRKAKGWDTKKILTTPIAERKGGFTAHCRANGLNPITVNSRIRSGWHPERAITEPSRGQIPPRFGKRGSLKGLARKHKIEPSTLQGRLKKGWSLRRALTTPCKPKSPIKFRGVSALAKKHGINATTIACRLRRGCSLEAALNPEVVRGAKRNPNSILSRAKAAGINYGTVMSRIDCGWSVERALETPTGAPKPLRPNSLAGKLRELGVSYSAYNHRRARGWSHKKAVETPVRVLTRK